VSRPAFLLSIILSSNLCLPVFAYQTQTPNPGQRNQDPVAKPKPPGDTPPPDTATAKREGEEDGFADGRREAEARAYDEGRELGRRYGYQRGFEVVERERKAEEYQAGYSRGTSTGTDEGERDGTQKGNDEGDNQGLNDGTAQGRADAEAEAVRAAVPPGREKGEREAEAETDRVTGQARADAIRRADADAQAEAEKVDYKRGRDTYRTARFAEPTRFIGVFSQRKSALNRPTRAARPAVERVALVVSQQPDIPDPEIKARPDNRFRKPRRTYEFAEQTEAYTRAYNGNYPNGWQAHFRELFIRGFRLAYLQGWDVGRYEARNASYVADHDRGYEEGRREAYQRAYSKAFTDARNRAYNRAFANARSTTYSRVYPGEYERVFEETRRSAYDARLKAIYDAAYRPKYELRYAETYATASREQYNRGRSDEAEVFRVQPVRVTGLKAVGALEDGVIEPNEPVRLIVRLRNFSKQTIRGSDVRLMVQSAAGIALDEFEARPVADLAPESEAEFTEIFAVRFPETVVGGAPALQIRAMFGERESDTQALEVPVRFATVIRLGSETPLAEGLPRTVTVSVRNITSMPLAADAVLRLSVDSKAVEFAETQAPVGNLAPGESRTVSFQVTARTTEEKVQLPVSMTITGGNRKLGALAGTPQLAIRNPYRVIGRITGAGLRAPGLGRLEYSFRNASSPDGYHSLQLRVRVTGDDSGAVEVLGPNPQYLTPLGQSKSSSFVVPVVVRKANAGGIIELELLEDGVPVVVHRMNY
jgi:hypothetical protein